MQRLLHVKDLPIILLALVEAAALIELLDQLALAASLEGQSVGRAPDSSSMVDLVSVVRVIPQLLVDITILMQVRLGIE